MARRFRMGVAALLLAGSVGACRGDDDKPEPLAVAAEVVVRPKRSTLTAGGKVQLAAQINDASGKPIGGADLKFESSNSAVLRVSQQGLVRSVGPTGAATITVRSSNRKATVLCKVVAGVAAILHKHDGDAQTVQVTKSLGEALVVRITDRAGNPVGGSRVSFRVQKGGGRLTPTAVVADAAGLAKTYWTAGTKTGQYTVVVSSPGLEGSPLTFTATVAPGSPTRISRIGDAPKKLTAGEAVPLRVQVVDEFGNPASAVDIVWAIAEGKGSLKPESGRPDASGTAETVWTPTAAGAGAVTSTAANLDGSPLRFRAKVVPGSPAQLAVVSGDKQRGPVGKPLKQIPVVRVTDVYGNPVKGAAVAFEPAAGGGKVLRKQTTSDEEGFADCGGWIPGRAGRNELVARLSGPKGPVVQLVAEAPARLSVGGVAPVPARLRRFSALLAAPPSPRFDKPLTAPLAVAPGGGKGGAGQGCKPLTGRALAGAAILVMAGTCPAAEMEANLAAAGAGVILVYHPNLAAPVLMEGFAGKLPALMLGRDDAGALLALIAQQRRRPSADGGVAAPPARSGPDGGVLPDGGAAPRGPPTITINPGG